MEGLRSIEGRWRKLSVSTFAWHLIAFCAVAWFFLNRNVMSLLSLDDGATSIVDAMRQSDSHHGPLELFTSFGQSLGNVQFLYNKKLFFFFWPLGSIADLATAKVVVYLAIGVARFLAPY